MKLAELYRAIRARTKYGAAQALQHARQARDAGRAIYAPSDPYNQRNRDARGHLTECRWIESTERAGLRFVDFADKLDRSIRHSGWYTDDDGCSDLMRGAVWQLPARNGCAIYVAGYVDPNNDGAAFIDFTPILGERGAQCGAYCEAEPARLEAARAGDSIAERCAETEREYQRKWQAARRVEDARAAIQSARESHGAIAAEMRTARKAGDVEYPALCAALRRDLAMLRRTVSRAAREIRDAFEQHGDDILEL